MHAEVSTPARRLTPFRLRTTLGLCALGLGVMAGGYGCQQRVEASSARAATALRRDIVEQIPLNGQLVVPPSAQASITAPFLSTVERVYRSVGQRVAAGDAIVKLTVPTADAFQHQASAEFEQAHGEYERVQRQYQPQIGLARQHLAAAEEAVRVARQASAQAGAAPSQSGGDQAQSPGVTDDGALRQALQRQQEAKLELEGAHQAFAQALATYRGQVARAQRSAEQARIADSQGVVRAPLSGAITALNAQPGRQVGAQPNVPVATIVDLDALQVRAPVTAEQAGQVTRGMTAVLVFDELPGKMFSGRLEQLTAAGGGYVAVVSFRNIGWRVKPGDHPRVDVRTGRVMRHAVVVPSASVARHDDEWVVDVRQGGRWVARRVTPGVSDGLFTAIQSGLQEGQTVRVPAESPSP